MIDPRPDPHGEIIRNEHPAAERILSVAGLFFAFLFYIICAIKLPIVSAASASTCRVAYV